MNVELLMANTCPMAQARKNKINNPGEQSTVCRRDGQDHYYYQKALHLLSRTALKALKMNLDFMFLKTMSFWLFSIPSNFLFAVFHEREYTRNIYARVWLNLKCVQIRENYEKNIRIMHVSCRHIYAFMIIMPPTKCVTF